MPRRACHLWNTVSMTTASRQPFRKGTTKRFSTDNPSRHKRGGGESSAEFVATPDADDKTGEAILKTQKGESVFPRCTHCVGSGDERNYLLGARCRKTTPPSATS
ncbi:hypothetical protein TNCV_2040951 [Trichonephila clavipes]|nr:hypothetical protein TNCV_2040951 [Trichonephila clavipes]